MAEKKKRKRLPRAKAIKAFCKSCNGGSSRAGCSDAACPFYAFLKEHRQLAGSPDLWWTLPTAQWDEAEEKARKKKRRIRKEAKEEVPVVAPEEEEEEEEDEEDEKEEESEEDDDEDDDW